jgi:hypothetical protein
MPSIFARPKRLRRLLDRTSTTPHTSLEDDTIEPAMLVDRDDATNKNIDPEIVPTLADEVTRDIDWDNNTDTDTPQDSASFTLSKAITRPPALFTRQSHTATKFTHNKRDFVISTILTQNAHGLRRRARDADGHILPNSPFDYTRYEHLIATIKLKEIDVYFIQETWLEGNVFDETINGYHVFCHNGDIGNHTFRGVAIVLSPRYYDGWKAAGARPPITTNATGEFAGRFISLNIQLANNDATGKQIRGKRGHNHLALTLISVYHPCTKTGDDDTYLHFLDTLDDLLNKAPATSSIVMGADVNSNIGKLDGVASVEFHSALGPHGLPRRNMKGESLLHVYLGHRLRVMNTFFESKIGGLGHGTWTSNRPTKTGIADSHMLGLLVCSTALHKRTRNCYTTLDGLDSDHRATALALNLTSIKFKAKSSLNCGDINWRIICEEETHRTMYNKYLMQLTSRDMSYDSFCEAVVRAGAITAMTFNQSCTGWYAASECILAPAIQEKNRLRHRLHDCTDLSPDEMSHAKIQFKLLNKQNHDLVELAKARWYKGLCEKIHQMNMDPRTAWEHIHILTGGETAHHTSTINMAMKLENGNLASNTKENMSVFGAHFHKVLNNHRPVDHTVLNLLDQKPHMTTLDNPITFAEVNHAINKLKKGKSPGLNGIPPEALKAMDTDSRRTIHRHVCDFFNGTIDHEGWHRSQCIPVPKRGDLSDPNKWRGIRLMDMCSKVFSSVMTRRAFALLDKHRTRFQFGRTLEIGCRDGLFTLKALLNARHNHDLA